MPKAQSYHFEREPDDDDSGDHPEVEDIGKFFTGELTGEANREIERHLAGCDRCRQELVTHLRFAQAAVPEEELQLVRTLPGMSLDKQVRHVLQQFPEPVSRPLTGRRVLDWLENWSLSPSAAPAMAVAILLVVSFAGLKTHQVYQQRQYENEVARGQAALQREWFVSSEDLRPPGNFALTPFSRARGPVPNAAATAFQQALERKPESREARLGLAVFYTFAGQLFSADSLLQVLLAQDSTDAEAWNQRGLVQARMENDEAALAAFATALRHRPSYAEAAYNRAQLLTRLQRKEEALLAWQDYLQRDAASDWAEVAKAQIQLLQTL